MLRINREKENTSTYRIVLCIFVLLTIDSAFISVNDIFSGRVRVVINIAAVILLAFACGGRIKLTHRDLIVYGASVLVPIVSGIIIKDIKQTTIIFAAISCGWLLTRIMGEEDFLEIYEKILYFLSVYSLIAMLAFFMLPIATKIFPIISGIDSEHIYYNFFFSIIADNAYVTRNYGLFWEPGAFSIFLNIAIWIQLYVKKQAEIKRVIVFIITILSTLSTLGIVCVAILVFGYFLKNKKTRNVSMQVVLVLTVIVAGVYLYFFGEDFIFHVFGKLQGGVGNYGNSTNVRLDAIKYPFQSFCSSPLFGIGYNEFLRIEKYYCDELATCTLVNWLALYGLMGGLFLIVSLTKFFTKREKNLLAKIVLVAFAILLFSTENFIQITLIYILIFYGADSNEKRFIHRN